MATFDPEKITFFAKTDARGQERTFGIKARDRQRHMYIVGKTGMGKSTLLENMAAQDIQNGEGMAFIDPHGSAADTLLDYVPEHRIDDVVYFAPFDLNHPVSFNVMEDVGADKRHLVVSGLMSTFKKIWVDAWSARMEYILTNALLALIEYPDTTLLSVNRLFIDKGYREKVVNYVKDPAVKAYWTEEFANYTERFAAEALPAIQNKIGQFTGNPLIRNIIGQPHSSFNIREIMDQKKILIMNLSKGLIGETNANLLGSMLTTRIYLAAMSRADLAVEEMRMQPNFYFYVDEFQSFANSTFANILSEARKYHLNLIIAHQYIAQMEEEVRDAVFGNVGTTVAFRVGPFDGELLETVFAPRFTATDLVNLGFAQIYLTLMIDGIGSQPFSAVTLPPIQRPPKSHRNQVINRSRALYADTRDKVEKVVDELHMPTVTPNTKGKKNKNNYSNSKSDTGKKNDSRANKVSNGPQTTEELKTVLARVAKENGGTGKESETEKSATKTEPETSLPEADATKDNTNTRDNQVERFADVEAHQQAKEQEKSVQPKRKETPQASDTDTSKSKEQRETKESTANTKSEKSVIGKDDRKDDSQPKGSDQNDGPDNHTNLSQTVERFRDVERARQSDSEKREPKQTSNNQHQGFRDEQKKSNHKAELKAALAEVLQEANQKQVYQVPAFSPTNKTQTSTPTIRVVKPQSVETPPPPATPIPKPEVVKDDPLNPKVIKKMLQNSQPEKSPMNS